VPYEAKNKMLLELGSRDNGRRLLIPPTVFLVDAQHGSWARRA
jgi:hypothetical protein